MSFVRRISRAVPLRRDACSGPRFANRSQMTRVSGAACVELNTPRGGLGEHDARRGQLENPGKSSARAHLRSSKCSSVRRVSAVSRDRKHADAARVRLRDVTRALGRSGLTRRGWHTPLSWMSNPRVAREHPAGCEWDSRWISAADLSAGFKEAVDARGCGARCTRRARERCAVPESVTGASKNLRGTKRQSDESSGKGNRSRLQIDHCVPDC